MTTIEWAALILILLAVPAFLYLCFKLAAEGWTRGKIQAERLENKHQPKKGNDENGSSKQKQG